MQNYKDLVKEIMVNGISTDDRTGVGTLALFGRQLSWDLSEGFPAVTVKKLAWSSVVSELLWFLSGSTNVNDLRERLHGSREEGKTIWDANYEHQGRKLGYSNGELGPVYGYQWRNFNGHDQIQELIRGLQENPSSRRHLVSAWNVGDLNSMTLPPCHYGFQCSVRDGKLDLLWTQRSVDTFLGLPFNIASYALLTHILAQLAGLKPGVLTFQGGDVHIYKNHVGQCLEMLKRSPMELPSLELPKFSTLEEVLESATSTFKLKNYKHHGTIKAPMAV